MYGRPMRVAASLVVCTLLMLGVSAAAPAARLAILPTVGAALVTAAVSMAAGHRARRVVVGVLVAGAAGWAVDWILADVLGAGYPSVRAARGHLTYPAVATLGFGVLAVVDHRPALGRSRTSTDRRGSSSSA